MMSKAKSIKIGKYQLEISNWDKVIFKKENIKKSDVVEYYEKIADYMIPLMKDYVVTLHRFPDGIDADGFYQKKYQTYYPDFIKSVDVKLKKGGNQKQIICNKKVDLVYLVGQATIDFHIWLSKIHQFNKPSRIVFDLDPPEKSQNFSLLVDASLEIRKCLKTLSLKSFVMTTGSKGLHVVVPIKATRSFDEVHKMAKRIAKYIADAHAADFTVELSKEKRRGRLFIDYTRNAYGQTSIAPYSLRAIASAPVATPLSWEELKSIKSSQEFTFDTIFKRLAKINDPWLSYLDNKPILKNSMLSQVNGL